MADVSDSAIDEGQFWSIFPSHWNPVLPIGVHHNERIYPPSAISRTPSCPAIPGRSNLYLTFVFL